MNYIVEVPSRFDILDATIYRCLSRFISGSINFSRKSTTYGSAIYHLHQDQLGNLGSIELYKIHEEITQIHVNDPFEPEYQEAILYILRNELVNKADILQKANSLIELGAPSWLIGLIIHEIIPPNKAAQKHENDGTINWFIDLPRNESQPIIEQTDITKNRILEILHNKRKEYHKQILEELYNCIQKDRYTTIKQQITDHRDIISPNRSLDRGMLIHLHQFFDKHFNEEELRTVCFDLEIDYESLPAKGKTAKARELVDYCKRHGRIDELIADARRLRPNASWGDAVDEAQTL